MRRRVAAARVAAAVAIAVSVPLASAAAATATTNQAGFSQPATIDNPWFPLVPGTQFTYVGRANRGHGELRHRVVFTVSDLTKVVDGVRTRVLWDRDINAGRLQENEITFHAQDDAGAVWNFGEYPEQYRAGKLTGAPDTWLAGLRRAEPGIVMPAQPRVGTPSYLQGFAPDIDFADRARVYRTGLRICIPRACFRNVLLTDEWNPAEPGAHQRKYYARGVGNIRVGAAGHDPEDEVLVLHEMRLLTRGALIWVRQQVLKIDARAYRVRADVYGHTAPAERGP
jgi:hypothetical protein